MEKNTEKEIFKAEKPTYDISLSYEENYQKGPFFDGPFPKRVITKKKRFLDFEVNSLIGVPAGPLLNANWIRAYAALGFDLPVYKTVRTKSYPSHPPPNCLLVDVEGQLTEKRFGEKLKEVQGTWKGSQEDISITNSFGMPSRDPHIWQEDVERAKGYLKSGQILTVSVVGTMGEGNLASDYSRGAAMAREAGADMVEINLSCPNVSSGEGEIFTDPSFSKELCREVKKVLKDTPLIIKIGYVTDPKLLQETIRATAPFVDVISGINTLSFEIINQDNDPALPGENRLRSGICGASIRHCGMEQTKRLVHLRKQQKYDFAIIGVGGIMTVKNIQEYLEIGADAAMSATGAMWDPYLAYRFWKKENEPTV